MLYPVLLEPIKRIEELNLEDINMSITKVECNAEFWLSDDDQTLTFDVKEANHEQANF